MRGGAYKFFGYLNDSLAIIFCCKLLTITKSVGIDSVYTDLVEAGPSSDMLVYEHNRVQYSIEMQADNQAFTEPRPSSPVPTEGRNTILGILAIAMLVGMIGAAATYAFFFAGKVASESLIRETIGASTYLRPKQWTVSPRSLGEGVRSFGDWSDGGDTGASATVAFREAAHMPKMVHANDKAIEALRKELLASESEDVSPDTISPACASMTNSRPVPNTKKNTTITGLVTLTSTCQRKDGQKTASKIRIAIGDDGVLRVISITAHETSWQKNEAVFEKMLDSVEQVVKINS